MPLYKLSRFAFYLVFNRKCGGNRCVTLLHIIHLWLGLLFLVYVKCHGLTTSPSQYPDDGLQRSALLRSFCIRNGYFFILIQARHTSKLKQNLLCWWSSIRDYYQGWFWFMDPFGDVLTPGCVWCLKMSEVSFIFRTLGTLTDLNEGC